MPARAAFAARSVAAMAHHNPYYDVEVFAIGGGTGGGASTQTGYGGGAGGTFNGYFRVLSGAAFAVVIGAGGANGGSGAFGTPGARGATTTGFGLSTPLAVQDPTLAGSGAPNFFLESGNHYQPGPPGNGHDAQHAGGAGGPAGANTLAPGVTWGPSTYGGGGPSGASSLVSGYTGAFVGLDGAGTGAYDVGAAIDAAANRGGGGGGSRSGYFGGSYYNSSNGGSGVLIVRYRGAQRGTGGTVTSSGGYTYHTFTTSGTFTA